MKILVVDTTGCRPYELGYQMKNALSELKGLIKEYNTKLNNNQTAGADGKYKVDNVEKKLYAVITAYSSERNSTTTWKAN